jgi:carbon-monoxide dehydrogenase medium subunit
VIPAAFDYLRPHTLDEALDALADPETLALAGGQSLLPLLKLRLARPARLCDLAALDLRSIEIDEAEVRIGALTTWDDLARAVELAAVPGLEAVRECARAIGDLQVRNRGTIGGGAAHADPAADMPAVLLALDARIRLRSPDGAREILAEDFFLGPYSTARADGELIVEIAIPRPGQGARSAYVAVEHPASGYALAGACALVAAAGTRVALTGVAARPLLARDGGLPPVEPLADAYAPADYRRRLAGVVAQRARARAEGAR